MCQAVLEDTKPRQRAAWGEGRRKEERRPLFASLARVSSAEVTGSGV